MFFFRKCTWDAAFRSFLANRCCASWDSSPPSTSHTPPPSPFCFSSSSDVRPLPLALFLLFFCLGPKIHKQRPSNLFLPKLLSTIWFSEQVTQPAGGKGGNTGGGGEGRGREERRGRRLDKLCSGEILRAFFGKTDDNRSASLQLSLVNAEKTPWRSVGPRMTSTPVALVTCFELMQPFQSLTNWKRLCGDSRVECVNQSHWSLILFFFFLNFHSYGSWPRLSRKWGRLSWTAPFVMNHVHLQILVLQPWTWRQTWKKDLPFIQGWFGWSWFS